MGGILGWDKRWDQSQIQDWTFRRHKDRLGGVASVPGSGLALAAIVTTVSVPRWEPGTVRP